MAADFSNQVLSAARRFWSSTVFGVAVVNDAKTFGVRVQIQHAPSNMNYTMLLDYVEYNDLGGFLELQFETADRALAAAALKTPAVYDATKNLVNEIPWQDDILALLQISQVTLRTWPRRGREDLYLRRKDGKTMSIDLPALKNLCLWSREAMLDWWGHRVQALLSGSI